MAEQPPEQQKTRRPRRRGSAAPAVPDRTAVVSHEIRGPLGVITALTELLLSRPLQTADRHAVELIRLAGHHLTTVADDLVAEATLGMERFVVRPAEFAPAETLHAIAALYAPLTVGSARTLDVEIDPDAPAVVSSDESRVRQILFNLVSNASKATTTGRILLSLRRDKDGTVVFDVADDGPGLPDGFVPSPYNRGSVDGTGLGLWISMRIAEALKGRLTLTGRPEGGTLARLTIPSVFTAEPPPEDDVPAAPEPGPRRRGEKPVRRRSDRRPGGGAATGASLLAGRHALIVDDSPVSRMLLGTILKSFDMTFEEAADGSEAMAHYDGRRPDILLLDWTLAQETAAAVLSRLERFADAPLPPVVIVTGATRTQDDTARPVLRKPFTPRELHGALQSIFGAMTEQVPLDVP